MHPGFSLLTVVELIIKVDSLSTVMFSETNEESSDS